MKLQFSTIIVTLACLTGVHSGAQPPIDVVRQFVRLDTEGRRLTVDGWRAADQLLTDHSTPPQEKRIVVIAKHYKVSESGLPANTAYYLGYWQIGRLDSALRFHPFASRIETRFGDKFAVQKTGAGWKIRGSQPREMHLTPSAAIRYLTEIGKRSSAAIKSNAAKSLATLKRYQ
jgi:hypothetical protein